MTPFDVIKTRLQTQRALDPLFQPPTRAGSVTCCQTTIQAPTFDEAGKLCRYDPRMDAQTRAGTSPHLKPRIPRATPAVHHATDMRPRVMPNVFVSASNMSATACAFPDREVAARELRAVASEGRLGGLWDGAIKIGRQEGIKGLWRGLSPTLVMTVPSQVTYMTCYDHFRLYFLELGPEVHSSGQVSLSNVTPHTLGASLAAGAIARSISATLVTPLELLRTRLQATTSGASDGVERGLSNVFRDLGRQVSREGPTVMFRGLVPTLYRDVPFSAIYFAGYESMKRVLTGSGLGERNDDAMGAQTKSQEFATAFVSGATSGIVAAIFTQPFDLIKTRLQAEQGGGSNTANGRSVMSMARNIVQNEGGFMGLFQGMSPRAAKVAPACGIMIASFEVVGRWLEDHS